MFAAKYPVYLLKSPWSPAKRLALCLLAACCTLVCGTASARVVEAKLSAGTIATAEYKVGKPNLPALLLLHGFLQTREYPTLARLADALGGMGFTTLSPTLSLGISKRAKSLPCEAIHRHNMGNDIGELGLWIDWLANHGHQDIVLIGHSYGSLQILIYTTRHPNPAVRKIILLSLVDADQDINIQKTRTSPQEIKLKIAQNDQSLAPYQLSYCQRYLSSARDYLSYAEWSRGRILNDLTRIKRPISVIMGEKDDRMGADWPNKMNLKGIDVTLVKGANHFFEAEYEFELVDIVAAQLRAINSARVSP